MKKALATLLLILSVITASAQADLNIGFGAADAWGEFEEQDSNNWYVDIPFCVVNLSSTDTYHDNIRIVCLPMHYENGKEVMDSTKRQTFNPMVNLAPKDTINLTVKLTSIPKSEPCQVVFAAYRKNGEWIETRIGRFDVPTAQIPSYITGEWSVNGWGKDDEMGFYMNPQLTINNSSSTPYSTTLIIQYRPIKNNEAIVDEEETNSTTVTIPAKGSYSLPLWLTELDSTAQSYMLDAWLVVDNEWAYLCYRNEPVPANKGNSGGDDDDDNPVNPDDPDDPNNTGTGDIVVVLKNGQTVGFMFDDIPVIKTGTGNTLVISTAGGRQITYSYDNIRRICQGDGESPTGIETVTQTRTKPVFHITSGGINITDLAADDEVVAYTLDGTIAAKAKSIDGQAQLSLSKESSVYIIRTKSGISFKFAPGHK